MTPGLDETPIFVNRACPVACDGNTGLARRVEELTAALDEANAHLAWARDCGKAWKQTAEKE